MDDGLKKWMDDQDWDIPEFEWPASSLQACHAMLTPREQNAIQAAAHFAVIGYRQHAEQARSLAAYDDTHRRADRYHRGLPNTFNDDHIQRGDN